MLKETTNRKNNNLKLAMLNHIFVAFSSLVHHRRARPSDNHTICTVETWIIVPMGKKYIMRGWICDLFAELKDCPRKLTILSFLLLLTLTTMKLTRKILSHFVAALVYANYHIQQLWDVEEFKWDTVKEALKELINVCHHSLTTISLVSQVRVRKKAVRIFTWSHKAARHTDFICLRSTTNQMSILANNGRVKFAEFYF